MEDWRTGQSKGGEHKLPEFNLRAQDASYLKRCLVHGSRESPGAYTCAGHRLRGRHHGYDYPTPLIRYPASKNMVSASDRSHALPTSQTACHVLQYVVCPCSAW